VKPSGPALPRTLSTLETWGFGFTVLLFWLVVAPEVHATMGPSALVVWIPASLAGIVVNLQIRKLALSRPDAAGGSPVYVAELWSDRPWVARWAGLAYFHSWAIVPPAISWFLAELAVENLAAMGHGASPTLIQFLILGAIYLTAFSGIRVLSVVHLFFLIPSLGLLLLFGVHGMGWLVLGEGSPAALPSSLELPGWTAWAAGYFLVAYTTYGIDTAAAFSADSRNPRATIECLVAAAVLVVPVMVGGSWILAQAGPQPGTVVQPLVLLESVAGPLWGDLTPLAVTFMLAASMVLACATSVAVSPRVAWQLGRDGVLAPVLGRLHSHGIPRIALGFATLVALLHIGLDPVEMILLGGATWIGFWCLMHLGLWRRREEGRVLWPRLALVLAVMEAGVLVVGGGMAGGWWVAGGLAIPFGLMIVDDLARRWVGFPKAHRTPMTRKVRWSQAGEILLVVTLILATAVAGWVVGRLVGPELSPEGTRFSVIVLLIVAFIGVAWASWTHLRRLSILERARNELGDVLEATMDPILAVSGEGRVLSANPAAERLFELPEASLLKRPLSDMVPGLDPDPARWHDWREYEVPGSSGPRTVELVASPAADDASAGITVTLRDLTERIAAEQALQESRQRLDLALEASRAGVWDLDIASGTVVRGKHLRRLLGYEAQGLEGGLEEWEELLHPEDRAEAVARLRKHLDGTSPIFESEHRIRRGDDRWLWVLERGKVVARDDQGRPTRVLGTTTDVSERRRLEQQFTQAQKMEAVGRLAGGVAHDFNNVLTAILGTTDLLLDEPEGLREEQRADLVEIRDAALRAAEITHQLLAFSRRQQLRPQTVDLNRSVERVQRLLRRLIGDNVVVRTECDPELAPIRADPVQVEQAIVNLALNARDAMPAGGVLTIETRGSTLAPEEAGDVEGLPPGPVATLSVSDTGEGMDPETRARLFEPFFTTKGPGRGTGLGLAMVYGFVRQSGGTVRVESVEGLGSTILLIFPTVDPEP
jgi:PAS domain S-box-containing protein